MTTVESDITHSTLDYATVITNVCHVKISGIYLDGDVLVNSARFD